MRKSEIKRAIITKGLGEFQIDRSRAKTYIPRAGDLAVFKVKEIGKHNSIQGVNGNNCYIFEGDFIMAAFGNRYASEQFEGYVPTGYHKEYQILGKGGAVGVLKSMHVKFEKIGPTNLKLVGYVVNQQSEVVNSKYLILEEQPFLPIRRHPFHTILSLGSSMDSGKTTSAAYLARGLKASKKRVAYIKLTGTVFTKDRHFVRDCGAYTALDFSNCGFPSTYMCEIDELLNLYETLMHEVAKGKPEMVIIEIADGLLQRETQMLLQHHSFKEQVDDVFLSGGDSMSALHGIQILKNFGYVPFGVGGLFSASPLLAEEVEDNTDIPVISLEGLESSGVINYIQPRVRMGISA